MLEENYQLTQSPYPMALARLLSSESTPKLGLTRMRALLDELGNPERKFPSIHVAGTNGKGSTCAFLASLLSQTHQRVGLYTSPHLLCARERIQINGELVSEERFCEAEKAVFNAANRRPEQPTFFERMTAMAFWIFAKEQVDMAVIEVGVGGRLDATNVIQPAVSVITRIDLDHTDILGDTLEKIATEKAGIIKPNTPVVTGFQDRAVLKVLQTIAKAKNAVFHEVTQPCRVETGLSGAHQKMNAALAIAAARLAGLTLAPSAIESALLSTRWPGRLEMFDTEPPVLIDGAHNPAGMRALVKVLLQSDQPLVLILGATGGHAAEAMWAELLPLKERIIQVVATKSRSPRALCSTALAESLRGLAPCIVTDSVPQALKKAQTTAELRSALIVAAGSLYVAGEVRGVLRNMPRDAQLPIF